MHGFSSSISDGWIAPILTLFWTYLQIAGVRNYYTPFFCGLCIPRPLLSLLIAVLELLLLDQMITFVQQKKNFGAQSLSNSKRAWMCRRMPYKMAIWLPKFVKLWQEMLCRETSSIWERQSLNPQILKVERLVG